MQSKWQISRAAVVRANSKIMAAGRTGGAANQTGQLALIDKAVTTPSNSTYDPEVIRLAGELAMSKMRHRWPAK